jgi:hypothetical protein
MCFCSRFSTPFDTNGFQFISSFNNTQLTGVEGEGGRENEFGGKNAAAAVALFV